MKTRIDMFLDGDIRIAVVAPDRDRAIEVAKMVREVVKLEDSRAPVFSAVGGPGW